VKNKLSDLNNHLFAQLERLGDEDIQGEALREEIERAKAMANIATQIVANGNLVIKAHEAFGLDPKGVLVLPLLSDE